MFAFLSLDKPIAGCSGSGEALHYCPRFPHLPISRDYLSYCVMDFSLQKRDEIHPLVLVFEPGYFLGVARLAEDAYLLLGPAGPQRPKREAILDMCREVIAPDLLFSFCDRLANVPTYSYRRFSIALSLAIRLCTGRQVPLEDILLCNNTLQQDTVEQVWQDTLFHVREQEEPARHTSVSFEAGVLDAIEHGDQTELRRRFLQPTGGSEGLMSMDILRQSKYTFISFVTMVTRAAIRGGIPQEEAFSLSDSYCQQMDRLMSPADVDALSYKMAMDFCGKVGQRQAAGEYSPDGAVPGSHRAKPPPPHPGGETGRVFRRQCPQPVRPVPAGVGREYLSLYPGRTASGGGVPFGHVGAFPLGGIRLSAI